MSLDTFQRQPSTPVDPVTGSDTALLGLAMIARFHSVPVSSEELALLLEQMGETYGAEHILSAAWEMGLDARVMRSSMEQMSEVPLPALAISGDGHYCVLAQVGEDHVLILVPGEPSPRSIPHGEFAERWSGDVIVFAGKALKS